MAIGQIIIFIFGTTCCFIAIRHRSFYYTVLNFCTVFVFCQVCKVIGQGIICQCRSFACNISPVSIPHFLLQLYLNALWTFAVLVVIICPCFCTSYINCFRCMTIGNYITSFRCATRLCSIASWYICFDYCINNQLIFGIIFLKISESMFPIVIVIQLYCSYWVLTITISQQIYCNFRWSQTILVILIIPYLFYFYFCYRFFILDFKSVSIFCDICTFNCHCTIIYSNCPRPACFMPCRRCCFC